MVTGGPWSRCRPVKNRSNFYKKKEKFFALRSFAERTPYTGATRIKVSHPTLTAGDPCPACQTGKVYATAEPGLLVRITGQAPLGAVVYELEKFRCSLCGEIFTAPAPEGLSEDKYDAEAAAMIALLRLW